MEQKEIKLTQKELKQISDTFKMLYDKGISYPDNYYGYFCGWECEGEFYVGTPRDGDEFVKRNNKAVWNFPIIKWSDYKNIVLKKE